MNCVCSLSGLKGLRVVADDTIDWLEGASCVLEVLAWGEGGQLTQLCV